MVVESQLKHYLINMGYPERRFPNGTAIWWESMSPPASRPQVFAWGSFLLAVQYKHKTDIFTKQQNHRDEKAHHNFKAISC